MATQQKKENKGIVLIKKSNNLVESRYRFDIWETRFFLSILSQIRKDDMGLSTYRIWYKDLIKTYDLKSGDAYASLRDAAKSLIRKPVRISYEKEGVKREQEHTLIKSIDYLVAGQERIENHEYIDVAIEEDMKPFLLQLQKNFTAYDLQNVVKLGVYSVRVYELLKQYESIGSRVLKIEEMRTMFELEKEYQKYNDFYRWVVKTSEAEINEYTDLMVTSIEKLKEGRRVAALKFRFRRKSEAEIQKMRGKPYKEADLETVENIDFEELPNEETPKQKTHSKSKILEAIISETTTHKTQFTEGVSEAVLKEDLIVELIPIVVTQFGVSLKMLMSLVENSTEMEIRIAIGITQKLIESGKIDNVAGFFVEAVRGKYQDKEEQKRNAEAQKQTEAKTKAEALRKAAEAEAEDKEAFHRRESARKMQIIRTLIDQDADILYEAVEQFKASFFGKSYDNHKSIAENIESPMLAGGLMNVLQRLEPTIFK